MRKHPLDRPCGCANPLQDLDKGMRPKPASTALVLVVLLGLGLGIILLSPASTQSISRNGSVHDQQLLMPETQLRRLQQDNDVLRRTIAELHQQLLEQVQQQEHVINSARSLSMLGGGFSSSAPTPPIGYSSDDDIHTLLSTSCDTHSSWQVSCKRQVLWVRCSFFFPKNALLPLSSCTLSSSM